MTASEIFRLLDAGYTKADIDAMADEQKETQTEQAAAQPEKEQETVVPEAEVVKPETEKRLEKIESILAQIAANSIAASASPEPEPKRNVVAEVLEHL